ncbi:hypothetical protein DSO57_1018980 [Entomophthora muscae]|uniref:Uncharacterized protein n=2 Tax=Entomophthora muscae TaxID=34485 RepID=A0ACC2UPN6_9FUNG|nr:hypothetical protein DSO57_1018978 [Entomophthora muscae]KAJ9088852.1 hypothetical protein DSO57_1018980 [Entomophthora muscae]
MISTFFTILIASTAAQNVQPDRISRAAIKGELLGLSIYEDHVIVSISENSTFHYKNMTSNVTFIEPEMFYPGRGALLFTSAGPRYTVNGRKGEIVKFTSNDDSAASKDFRLSQGFITDMYQAGDRLYASSFNYTNGAPLTTIWRFKEDEFKEWFTVDGLITKFVLGKSRKVFYGIKHNEDEEVSKELIKISVSSKCRDPPPTTQLVKHISIDPIHDTIARDADDNIYLPSQDNAVSIINSDLELKVAFNSSVEVTQLAVAEKNLYVGGHCYAPGYDYSEICLATYKL